MLVLRGIRLGQRIPCRGEYKLEFGGLCGWGDLFLVCHKLLSQEKVNGTQCVESCFRFSHDRKDPSHVEDVVLNVLLLDGLVVGRKYTSTDLLNKYL